MLTYARPSCSYNLRASAFAVTQQDRWRTFAGMTQVDFKLGLRLARLPSRDGFGDAIPIRQVCRLGCDRVPGHISHASHRGERLVDLVPVTMPGYFRGHADSRQPGRIKKNDALVSDFKFHLAFWRDRSGAKSRALPKALRCGQCQRYRAGTRTVPVCPRVE